MSVSPPARATIGPLVCVHWYATTFPSGSLLALPSSVTVDPSFATWSVPASATGGWFGAATGFTVTETLSVPVAPSLSVTVSRKTSVSAATTIGAVKVAVSVVAPASVTAVPLVCVHSYAVIVPSGSALALPSSVTADPSSTLLSAPAFATGAWFAGGTTGPSLLLLLLLLQAARTVSEKRINPWASVLEWSILFPRGSENRARPLSRFVVVLSGTCYLCVSGSLVVPPVQIVVFRHTAVSILPRPG